MVHDVPRIVDWSPRYQRSSKHRLDLDGGHPLADHALDRTHGVLGLTLEHDHDLAAVGTGPVEHEEVRERRHGDAEKRARLSRPVLLERSTAAADDGQAREVVRGLETCRHDDDVDGALDSVASTIPSRVTDATACGTSSTLSFLSAR